MVISNHYSDHHFQEWADTKPMKITVVDDGTSTNETYLGAVKDIPSAINKLNLDDEMLAIASDNVMNFSLPRFISYAKEKQTFCMMRYYECGVAHLIKSGVAQVDENDLIFPWKKKSLLNPRPTGAVSPSILNEARCETRRNGIASGCSTDAHGSYIACLCKQTKVHGNSWQALRHR